MPIAGIKEYKDDSDIPCISRDLKKVSKCLKKNYKENTYNCPETIVPKKLSYAAG